MQFRNIRIFTSFLFCITILNGCMRSNNENKSVMPSSLPKVSHHQFHPKMIWQHDFGKGNRGFYSNLHPVCQDSYLFAADRSGIVKALNVNTGEEIWSVNLDVCCCHGLLLSCNRCSAKLSGGLTATSTRVYLGSELARVYALNVQDGSIAWDVLVGGEVLSTPVISDDILLIHTSNNLLQALNENNGTVRWTVKLGSSRLTLRGTSSPTVAFDTVIVGDNNGQVSAVLINQGQIIWRQRISQVGDATGGITQLHDVKATPVIANGIVYTIAYNGNLAALDLYSGHISWSREIGSITNLLVNDNHIYLVDQDDRVLAVDTRNGMTIWQQNNLMYRNLTSPVLHNGHIVTGDSEGYLHWISIDNGQFVAQKKVDNVSLTKISIAHDKLIVQGGNDKIYAFIVE